jgi:cell division protein FtsI/penicillin-binding protein 2
VNTDRGLDNLAFIGYAPYDNPKVAVALIVPETHDNHANLYIAQDIFDVYNKLYPGQLK